MSSDVMEKLAPVIHSGFITQGPKVEELEQQLSTFLETEYLLMLNSATSGLTLALRLLMEADGEEWPGFDKKTDVVLTPALTCFATTASILAHDVKIGWLDVDPTTANISLEDLRKKLNAYTKVVYIVHWGGYPVDLDRLKELQEEHHRKYGYRFRIVEDCAHAFGATYKGQKLGSHGNICVFSLQAIKHLTTGDGGIITLPNKDLYERAKLLRWFGIDRDKRNYNRKDFRLENDIVEAGYKFHMNDINATIGLANLPHIPELLAKNRAHCAFLRRELSGVPGVSLLENKQDRESACWLFTLRVTRKADFIEKMKEAGIATSQVHNRNDINSCVSEFKCDLPNLDEFEKELICIPCGWWLSSEELQYIVDTIRQGW